MDEPFFRPDSEQIPRAVPAILSVKDLSKRFSAHGPPVVDRISFDVAQGEILALLGPSGCGKTTILRMIVGFERPDQGEVWLKGTMVGGGRHVPPEKRGIGMVFQDYALFPHLSVEKNVSFGLHRVEADERNRRVRKVVELLGLTGLEDRRLQQLSGGQQQRVALARTLATTPDLILLDEPFSNLDALLRQSTRKEIRDILKRAGMTAILVTHDQEEALSFADRVAVIWNGQIEQIGTPEQVYYEPRTLFVAQFLGRTNLLLSWAAGEQADTPLGSVALNRPAHGNVLLSLRPEHLTLEPPDTNPLLPVGKVLDREFRGHDITYRVDVSGSDYLVHMHNRASYEPGDPVSIRAIEPAVVLEKRTSG